MQDCFLLGVLCHVHPCLSIHGHKVKVVPSNCRVFMYSVFVLMYVPPHILVALCVILLSFTMTLLLEYYQREQSGYPLYLNSYRLQWRIQRGIPGCMPWIPPFQAEHCMPQKQDSQQLTEVQQSLPASTPVLSVQSSYKQSLENLNLQAWCMQQLASLVQVHCKKNGRVNVKMGVAQIFLYSKQYSCHFQNQHYN